MSSVANVTTTLEIPSDSPFSSKASASNPAPTAVGGAPATTSFTFSFSLQAATPPATAQATWDLAAPVVAVESAAVVADEKPGGESRKMRARRARRAGGGEEDEDAGDEDWDDETAPEPRDAVASGSAIIDAATFDLKGFAAALPATKPDLEQ